MLCYVIVHMHVLKFAPFCSFPMIYCFTEIEIFKFWPKTMNYRKAFCSNFPTTPLTGRCYITDTHACTCTPPLASPAHLEQLDGRGASAGLLEEGVAQEVVEVLRPLVLVLEAGGLEVAFGHQVQRPGGVKVESSV